MLLDELVLHNFGIYKGRHCVNLTPKGSNKPIILFGALNGGGKTTLLDALKLALYGKFANCSNRGSLSYSEFLRRTINRQIDAKEGAGIELQFRHNRNGSEDTIRIIRTWRSTGKSLKETIKVLRNEKFDSAITDRWYEYIEEFIPVQVSSLFFFDGEKIESLASEEQSAELIRTGLHALLGLDLVDRTSNDLQVIETKRKTALAGSKEKKEISEFQQRISKLEKQQSILTEKLASERTSLQNTLNRIKRLRDEFRRDGGELLEQQDSIEIEVKEAERQLTEAESKLRELASGAAPLMLVSDILEAAQGQAEQEKQTEIHKWIKDTLAKRDKEILASLLEKAADVELVEELKSLLSKDRKKRGRRATGSTFLHVAPEAFNALSEQTFKELTANVHQQIKRTTEIRERLSDSRRKLAAVPSPDALSNITEALQQAEAEKKDGELKTTILERELETLTKQLATHKEKHLLYLESVTEHSFVDETNRRILNHSKKLRDTLASFRHRIAEKHIRQLEKLILESFSQITRKTDLISRISIEPESYGLTLYTRTEDKLSPDRLSAGERQLLSIAILWGLAKVSDRPLPAVIDTPLGRLDSDHRSYLVNNYFPFASHQVLLLSTDEEIDQRYYTQLKKFITHQYNIEYNPSISSSNITPGYFERKNSHAH